MASGPTPTLDMTARRAAGAAGRGAAAGKRGRMLARFRDWLLARVKARAEDEAARARARAALAASRPPSADFVSELLRALGRVDQDRPRGALGEGRSDE